MIFRLHSVIRAALLTAACCPTLAYAQSPAAPVPAGRDLATDLACAPIATDTPPSRALQVTGGQSAGRMLFAQGDTILIGAGTIQGLQIGREYFVRRLVANPFMPHRKGGPYQVHTAGWVRITDTHADRAVATITHACDEVTAGDYLEPLELPAAPVVSAPGQADLTGAGRLIFGDEWTELGGTGSYMVLDRGSAHGIRAGQHVTIFRPAGARGRRVDAAAAARAVRVGEATAMLVGPQTTTLRVDTSEDVIYVGDLGAINRQAAVTNLPVR